MTGTLPANTQRRAAVPMIDRLSLALEAPLSDQTDIWVDADEAEAESARLYGEGMRGDFGPWTVSRTIALAAQWPQLAILQINTARLLALTSDEATIIACWRGVLARFPASDDALHGYTAALAKGLGEAQADAIFAAYRPGQARNSVTSDASKSTAAVETLLAHARDWRTKHPPIQAHGILGPIILIGGTLGGGGAERQLVNSAIGLRHRFHGRRDGDGSVKVYCRKLDSRRGHDFHLPALEQADIPVIDYLRAEPFGGSPGHSRLAALTHLIDKLPHRMREGVIQLTDLLRHEAPQTVQIWQDGGIFAAGLAALLANVPRIVLTVRTMPPSERADRRKPEQEALYRGLLAADGVTLTANSRTAACAYEAWLGLPERSVAVIANGVSPLPTAGSDEEKRRWAAFDAKTGAGFTLGGVMRLDDNKRPLDWLAIAAALSEKQPDARFLLVGAGPLRAACEDFVRRNVIAERVLFVGRSSHVGFWLEKIDALALTSRHEGVPNVLIEAQLAGKPVVTTPAGGASEAVAPVEVNRVLDDRDTVAHNAAASHLVALAERTDQSIRQDSEALCNWAADLFATDRMIKRTLEIFQSN